MIVQHIIYTVQQNTIHNPIKYVSPIPPLNEFESTDKILDSELIESDILYYFKNNLHNKIIVIDKII